MLASTWSEELIAEWLGARGYAVFTNVPVGTGRKGGRREADVIGFIAKGNMVEVEHYEVGSLWESSQKIITAISNKFNQNHINSVKQFIVQITGVKTSNIQYNKYAILMGSPGSINKAAQHLRNANIILYHFKDFFNSNIIPIICSKVKTGRTFPGNMWLLNILYGLCQNGIICDSCCNCRPALASERKSRANPKT